MSLHRLESPPLSGSPLSSSDGRAGERSLKILLMSLCFLEKFFFSGLLSRVSSGGDVARARGTVKGMFFLFHPPFLLRFFTYVFDIRTSAAGVKVGAWINLRRSPFFFEQ